MKYIKKIIKKIKNERKLKKHINYLKSLYPIFFFTFIFLAFNLEVNAYAGGDVGGTYQCYNGGTLLKTGSNTWSDSNYPSMMKNWINCPSGWTNVNISIPRNVNNILGDITNPFSWFFETSGNMSSWSVLNINTNKYAFIGDNYISSYNVGSDDIYFAIFNNGNPFNSFWLYMPSITQLDSASLATFQNSDNINNVSNFLATSSQNIINNNNSNTQNIINNQNQSTQNIINNQNNSTNTIINNQNETTQNMINNQNQNTQDMIDNQNQNTQDMINNNNSLIKGECSMQPVRNILNPDLYRDNTYQNIGSNDKSIISNSYWWITGYQKVEPNTQYMTNQYFSWNGVYYDKNLNPLSTMYNDTINNGGYGFLTPNNAEYLVLNISKSISPITGQRIIVKGNVIPTYEPYKEHEVCEGGVNGALNDVNNGINDVNNSINDSSIDNSSANDFFSNFQYNDHGLSSIITAPLQFIKNLNNNVCSPLSLQVPFVSNNNLVLPCMSEVYSSNFNSFFTIYQTITTGFIAYWVAIKIFALVKGFKDPDNDKLEVMDL